MSASQLEVRRRQIGGSASECGVVPVRRLTPLSGRLL